MLSPSSLSETNINLSDTASILVDTAHSRALIATYRHLIAMDLATAALTLLPGNSGAGKPMALDAANNRVLVTDNYSKAVEAIDLTSGSRSLLSQANLFSNPASVTLDAANNRALVIDYRKTATTVAVDLTTGASTVLMPSPHSTPDAVNPLAYPAGIALDLLKNRVLVADASLKAVVAVDLNNGKRSILSSNTIPNAENPFLNPRALVIDQARNRALVVDNEQHAVVAVELTTGVRTQVSKDWRKTGLYSFYPEAIMLDTAHNRALVVDEFGLVAMDLGSGEMTLFSREYPFNVGVALDPVANRLLLLYLTQRDLKGLIAMDLTTQKSSLLAQLSYVDMTNLLPYPAGAVIDSARNRMLVTNLAPASLVALDLTTGAASVLQSNLASSNSVNAFEFPWGIALDSSRNRAVILDTDLKSIFVVDLITGERVLLSR